MTKAKYKIFFATILNPKNDMRCDFYRHGVLILKQSDVKKGYVVWRLDHRARLENLIDRIKKKNIVEIFDYEGQLIIPGLIDLHFHWVQDDVRQRPKDSLLEWLSLYTWPHEANFKDRGFSLKKAKSFAQSLLEHGTLGGACYGSIHTHTVDHAIRYFKGDFKVGNVIMTMHSPEYLTQSKSQAVKIVTKQAKRFTDQYVVTPRFAPTVHPDVMKDVGRIARNRKIFVQTHLSETKNEIDYVMQIFRSIPSMKHVKHYTDIYQKVGLLGPRSIMGHAIHLSLDEWKLMGKTKTAIAHCPTSNAPISKMGLGSGLFDIKMAKKHGVRWALGSDIGGGPFLSMFDVMQSFVSQQKKAKASYVMALNRSSRAGASILGHPRVGHLDPKTKAWANFITLSLPKNADRARDAESLLKLLIAKPQNQRHQYQSMVQRCFLRGKEIFTRCE